MPSNRHLVALTICTLIALPAWADGVNTTLNGTCITPDSKSIASAVTKIGTKIIKESCEACMNIKIKAKVKFIKNQTPTGYDSAALVAPSALQFNAVDPKGDKPEDPPVGDPPAPTPTPSFNRELRFIDNATITTPAVSCSSQANVSIDLRYLIGDNVYRNKTSKTISVSGIPLRFSK